ncbi:MAG: PD40 domain-containing protein [Chloroflexi bacterium]|nr:PD40 domain-containing protein [Chloroflexota bacterium]
MSVARRVLLLTGLAVFLISVVIALARWGHNPPAYGWIVFSSDRSGVWQYYRMRPDGSKPQRLRTAPSVPMSAQSPNGEWVVFIVAQGSNADIYVRRTDGSERQRLTYAAEDDWSPSWSPDSQWIFFTSGRSGSQDIYRMRADGSAVQRLTDSPADDRDPVWQPPIWRPFYPVIGAAVGLLCIAAALGSLRP